MSLHRLLILPLAALPLVATTAFAQDTATYRTWDRNDDGVITRAEWRGSMQEFRNLDWNLDGVLSGREIWSADALERTGNWEDEFTSLDRNRNGRISRGEWRGERAAFLRIDRNRDNQVTRDEFLHANVAAPMAVTDDFDALDADYSERIERHEWTGTRAAFNRLDLDRDGRLTRRELALGDATRTSIDEYASVEQTVVVDPRQPWTHTGIYVDVGDVVTYRATGTIEMSTGSDRATPAGSMSGRTARNSPRPDQKAGALLLRVGNGPITAVGENGSFRVREPGQLSFGVNDDHFADNSGEYRVWVTVTPR